MKEIFGFEGGFTAACSRIFDLMILGFLWILCSLPIITIGASSAALYYATVKSVKNRNGYAVQEFFRSFRQNLVPGMVLWLIILAVSVILRLNIGILMADMSGCFLSACMRQPQFISEWQPVISFRRCPDLI